MLEPGDRLRFAQEPARASAWFEMLQQYFDRDRAIQPRARAS